jgi:CPA2 family monovalent cation:H+ antiporter-2
MTTLSDHVVLVGSGRVGGFVGTQLAASGTPLLVIEADEDRALKLKDEGRQVISGNAADPEVIKAANVAAARCVLVAIPDAFEGGQVVEQAREINKTIPILARAHSEAEVEHLMKHGATQVVMGEHELAKAMIAGIPQASPPRPPEPPAPESPATEKPAPTT